jgi:hypothetical protein
MIYIANPCNVEFKYNNLSINIINYVLTPRISIYIRKFKINYDEKYFLIIR